MVVLYIIGDDIFFSLFFFFYNDCTNSKIIKKQNVGHNLVLNNHNVTSGFFAMKKLPNLQYNGGHNKYVE